MSNDLLTEVMFWSMVIENEKRTILISPENESRVRSWLDARGQSGFITVYVSPHVPDDQAWIIDLNAMQAQLQQLTQQERATWRYRYRDFL
jgi:hypothetical protein